jgi:hypothetical protein
MKSDTFAKSKAKGNYGTWHRFRFRNSRTWNMEQLKQFRPNFERFFLRLILIGVLISLVIGYKLYDYYSIAKFAMLSGFTFLFWLECKKHFYWTMLITGFGICLYNPIEKPHFSRQTWILFDRWLIWLLVGSTLLEILIIAKGILLQKQTAIKGEMDIVTKTTGQNINSVGEALGASFEFVGKAGKLLAAYSKLGIYKFGEFIDKVRADFGDEFADENINGFRSAYAAMRDGADKKERAKFDDSDAVDDYISVSVKQSPVEPVFALETAASGRLLKIFQKLYNNPDMGEQQMKRKIREVKERKKANEKR